MKHKNIQALVSVLMTVYNREKYIAEAIESVLASSYTNFELIIVDDCSKDKSVEIARVYEQKDKRITVYVNEQNLGQFPNRNKAAEYAKGKYIKYLDSDDIIYPHGLEVMVSAMEKFPEAGIGFSSHNYKNIDKYPLLVDSQQAIDYHFFTKGFLYAGPSGTIYDTVFFNEINKFQDFGVASDFEFNLRATLNKPIVLFQKDLFYWRQHNDQEIKKRENEYIFFNYQIHKSLIFNTSKIEKEKRKQIYRNYKTILSRKAMKYFFQFKFNEIKNIIIKCDINIVDIFWALLPKTMRNL